MTKGIAIIMLFMGIFSFGTETRNPDNPTRGIWDLKAEKIWEITELQGQVLAKPIITIADSGMVYLFDQKQGLNYIINQRGRFLSTFGRKGQGPGEAANQAWLLSAGDRVAIYDFPSKLHFFTPSGKYIRSASTGMNTIPYFLTGDTGYISAPLPYRSHGNIQLVNLTKGTKNVLAGVAFKEILDRQGHIVSLPGITPVLRMGVMSDTQRIYYGLDNHYEITVIDYAGEVKNTFSLLREKTRISDEFKLTTIRNHLRGSRAPIPSKSDCRLLPSEIPYFSAIQFDAGWVLILNNPLAHRWQRLGVDIFSPEGDYCYRAVFSPGDSLIQDLSFGETIVVKQGYLYALLQDEDEEIKLVKYKISLPPH